MKENKANTLVNQYLREARKTGFYCYYELKVARGLYFYFSAIEEHQNESLPALTEEGLVWKLSDEDSRRKPCDGFSAPPLPAFLVIRFKKKFYFIHYSRILRMKQNGEKSISEEEADAISTRVFSVTD